MVMKQNPFSKSECINQLKRALERGFLKIDGNDNPFSHLVDIYKKMRYYTYVQVKANKTDTLRQMCSPPVIAVQKYDPRKAEQPSSDHIPPLQMHQVEHRTRGSSLLARVCPPSAQIRPH